MGSIAHPTGRMMDWDDLRIFLAVSRSESLSAAGKRLKVDPATVGRRIARLEDSVQARLFTKSPQGYALTDAGARLIPHAETAERATLAAGESLTGPGGLTGLIRLGAPDGCANPTSTSSRRVRSEPPTQQHEVRSKYFV